MSKQPNTSNPTNQQTPPEGAQNEENKPLVLPKDITNDFIEANINTRSVANAYKIYRSGRVRRVLYDSVLSRLTGFCISRRQFKVVVQFIDQDLLGFHCDCQKVNNMIIVNKNLCAHCGSILLLLVNEPEAVVMHEGFANDVDKFMAMSVDEKRRVLEESVIAEEVQLSLTTSLFGKGGEQ